ncbi:hypothetical protein Pyrfu_0552 [Pyrolobus fumarii 1A]|uniref:Uncharacterized protein n=1 Tax=Pyrolobus fumarii (strain DSM 11204 / 1A) TaxID=694429 RepID=G0EGX2_PYRF1|nr:hypothetical protein Pyrfu_0552 [Pyrolobus fumarii 1A]
MKAWEPRRVKLARVGARLVRVELRFRGPVLVAVYLGTRVSRL